MATTNTVRMYFTTAQEGEYLLLSLGFADPELKNAGGLAKVQAAAAAIIAAQPFANVQLAALSSADFVERTETEIDI